MHLLKLKLGVKRMFIVSTYMYEINMHHQRGNLTFGLGLESLGQQQAING